MKTRYPYRKRRMNRLFARMAKLIIAYESVMRGAPYTLTDLAIETNAILERNRNAATNLTQPVAPEPALPVRDM